MCGYWAHEHTTSNKIPSFVTTELETGHFVEAPSMKLLLLLVFLATLLDSCYSLQNCTNPCHKHAKCEVRNGIHGCYCSPGFTGPGIDADGNSGCYDDNECANATQLCGEKANCTNTMGSYFCMCKDGYKSSNGNTSFVTNDGTSCKDIDECSELGTGACGDHAECDNMDGGYSCTCNEGYQPSTGKLQFKANDGTSCQAIQTTTCELNNCITKNINQTLVKISELKDPLAVLQEINKNSIGPVTPAEVISYVEMLSVSFSLLSTTNYTISDERLRDQTLNEFVSTVNNFVQEDKKTAWEAIPADNRRRSLTKLMHAAEETTAFLSQNFPKMAEVDVNASDMAVRLYTFDPEKVNLINQNTQMRGDSIKISAKKKEISPAKGTVAVVFLRYDNIGALLSLPQNLSLTENTEDREIVGSSVIAAAIRSTPPGLYPAEKIIFTLKHLQPVGKKDVKCVFWNYSEDTMEGNWATEGCERIHSNSTHTSCRCNHLTHFAVLMSSNGSKVDAKDYILTRITQLGIIISLICLAMCIFTFWFFSEIQSTRTTIHKNLCCSLFLAEFIFLIGINMNTNKLFCSITAGLLHYFLLAAFAWMCIEGIHLYLIVVGVIYNKGFLHKNFYIFGYVSPAVVVGISAALGYKYYGTTDVCWLSTKNNFIWSFIGPACLIILVNWMAFGVIIYKVFRQTAMLKPEVSCYENIRSCARGALSLLFLLGATWIFGVLHVIQGSVATAYLFTVFNAFQGLFIFIFLCVLSRKIQDEYSRLFRNVPCCFRCLR
ncbi:adhesion G protein-coupled receptor L4 isoform X1 [Thamnophis elegans]|uniref:adhesion G protein-coupled receptor L4 isoform X1 n=2 Tax=Thamnophis elegans TaxID=35005 RepID=UPI00137903D8|nr:adhesion G protein-coupled receptor L4 isoform X1 [Thamnophis elegans]